MKNLPLNVIVLSETKLHRRDPIFEAISSSIRPGDTVVVVDGSVIEPIKDGYFTRVSWRDLKEFLASSDLECVLLTPDCWPTRTNFDSVRHSLSQETQISAPRSNSLPLYQRVVSPQYSNRGQMREFQKSWEVSHKDLFTSTPFVSVEGLGILSKYLLEAISGIELYSQRDVAWSISKIMAENDIPIRIDDSNYMHVSKDYEYKVALRYRTSLRKKFFYEKVAVSTCGDFEDVVASTASGATNVLSLAMIIKNEVKNLEKCIGSVRGIVEDITVVDTGSSDGTIELLEKMEISSVHFDWIDDFGAARDFALNSTNSDWVIHLDADEVFETDREELIDELARYVGSCITLFVNIFNHNTVNISDAFSHQMSRVVRRVDSCWHGMIHEQVFDRVGRRPPFAAQIESAIINHFGYSNTGDVMVKKAERNLKIALRYHDSVRSTISAINLGRTYILAGDSEKAEQLLEESLIGVGASTSLPVIYRLLIMLKLAKDDIDAARKYVVDFGSRYPRRADQSASEATVLAKTGEVEKALAIFRSLPTRETYPGDITFRKSNAAAEIGKYLKDNGSYFEACQIIFDALDDGDGLDLHPAVVVECIEKANIDPLEYYRRIQKHRLIATFGLIKQLQFVNPDLGARFLIGLLKGGVKDLVVLVSVTEIAKFAHLSLRLEVSAILRSLAMGEYCPLILSAQDEIIPIEERISSLYAAMGAFKDYRVANIYKDVLSKFTLEQIDVAIDLANEKYQLGIPSDVDGISTLFDSDFLVRS